MGYGVSHFRCVVFTVLSKRTMKTSWLKRSVGQSIVNNEEPDTGKLVNVITLHQNSEINLSRQVPE